MNSLIKNTTILLVLSCFLFSSCYAKSEHTPEEYENTIKEYLNYLNSVDEKIKLEESKYLGSLNSVDKKIQELHKEINDLKRKKHDIYKSLSPECTKYLSKKRYYDDRLYKMHSYKKDSKNTIRNKQNKRNTKSSTYKSKSIER